MEEEHTCTSIEPSVSRRHDLHVELVVPANLTVLLLSIKFDPIGLPFFRTSLGRAGTDTRWR